VTPDDRISPIVIFSGRFIAGGCWMGKHSSPAREQRKGRARAGPAELTAGGRERFGWSDDTTNVGRDVVPIA
jgi:hypothetical protein